MEIRFVLAYLGPAYEIHTEAARMSGAADPSSTASKTLQRLTVVIEQERRLRAKARQASPTEIVESLTYYMRNGAVVGYSVAAKAHETLAKIRGMLSDRVDLSFNMDSLRAQFQETMRALPVAPAAGALDAGETNTGSTTR